MPKSFFLTLCLLLYCLTALPQTSRRYTFTHYNTAMGLASNQINSTYQDKDGFLWIGSGNGLQRYDGVRYKTFRHKDNDSSSIPSNFIVQLLPGGDNQLWILSQDGKVGFFNTKIFRYTAASVDIKDLPRLKSTAQFKKLITDGYGHLFLIIIGYDLLTYNESTHEFSASHNLFPLKPEWKMTGFVPQPGTKQYWLSTEAEGIMIYNQNTGELSNAATAGDHQELLRFSKSLQKVSNLFFDKQHRLWFTCIDNDLPRVFIYDLEKKVFVLKDYQFDEKVLGFHEVRGFFEQHDSTIWVCGQKIFARYLEKQKVFENVENNYDDEHSIAFIVIRRLAEDREHNIWIGTGNNGLFRFNPEEEYFSNVKHINRTTGKKGDGAPLCFIEDKDGSILTSISENGLYRYDSNYKEIPLNIKGMESNDIDIADIRLSRQINTVWMAAQEGVYKYDQLSQSAKFYPLPQLKDRQVHGLAEDSSGNLWFGTQQGVYVWHLSADKKTFDKDVTPFAGIPPVKINKMMTSKSGHLWIGTAGQGAYVVDPVSNTVVTHFSTHASGEQKLPEDFVSSLLEYNDSTIILCTNTRIILYNRVLNKMSLMPNPEVMTGLISSIEKDYNGHIWVSTTASLYRITTGSKVFVQFNRDDGLTNDFFIPASSYSMHDGKMLFGLAGLFIAFNPAKINVNKSTPDIRLTDFRVMDKALPADSLLALKRIELGPDENSIVIDVSTMSFNSGYLLKYKLEGLDKEWKYADQFNPQLVYSYLPADNYTLLVTTVDAEGNTGKKTLQVSIKINPPFWKTWWFYSLLLLALAAVLFLLDKQRTRRKETMQKMRSNIAGNLHRDVNTALNNINILSEMARLKADKDIEKSKEYIGQIHGKSGHMIIVMDDMLWSIDPANDNMQKTVERMREYIETLNNRHGAGIEMLVDKKVETLKLDMQLRHDALQLFKDSIKNQVQCGALDINLHIGYEKSNLLYTIQFNTDNCDMNLLTNLLYSQEMKKRLKAMHAVMNTDIRKNNATLLLKVPVAG